MGNFFVDIINWLIAALGAVLSFIFGILPDSPIKLIDNSPIAAYLPMINYFIPLDFIVSAAEAWTIAIGVYYIYQTILRWVKSID